MRRKVSLQLLLLFSVLLVAQVVRGDDDLVSELLEEEADEEEAPKKRGGRPKGFASRQVVHPLTDLPDADENIETSYYFPDHADLRFPIGEEVSVLCHLRNSGDGPINVTYIMGSLNLPYDFNYHIQNFSYKAVGIQLPPGFEATFEYPFKLHPQLDPIEYQVAHTIFYENERESFSSTFFNKTVELYHPSSEVDVSSMLRSLVGMLLVLGGLYFVYNQMGKKPERARASSGGSVDIRKDWGEEYMGKGASKQKKGAKAKKA